MRRSRKVNLQASKCAGAGRRPTLVCDAVGLEDLRPEKIDPLTVPGLCKLTRIAAVAGEEYCGLVHFEVNGPLIALQVIPDVRT